MKKFDKEYATQWVDEMKWLQDRGIRYEFVKYIDDITTYKYKKTAALFYALGDFYSNKK